jgi:hypothetical protein
MFSKMKKKNYVTLGGIAIIFFAALFFIWNALLAQSIPAVSLYVITGASSTWDNYRESDLREIGCRLSEFSQGLKPLSDFKTPEDFITFGNSLQNSPCATRPLGAVSKYRLGNDFASMYYVLRVKKDNPWISIWDINGRKVSDFDIRSVTITKDKGSYYELSGSLNPNAAIDLWSIDVKRSQSEPRIDTLQFYLASEDLNDFKAELKRFAGFLFFRNGDGDYTTSKSDILSPSTLNFSFFTGPAFCSQRYEGWLEKSSNRISYSPLSSIALNSQPTNFSKTFFASQNASTSLWLAENQSRRQLTPQISLSMIGSGGLNLGITDINISGNVATSGYATCLDNDVELIAEVSNNSDQDYRGGDNITFSVNGWRKTRRLESIGAFKSKTYSEIWRPQATGTYTYTATINVSDSFPDDNSASLTFKVYSQEECQPAATKYYCHYGFCYRCPQGVLPPSRSCELRPNQECISNNVPCEAKVRE